MGESKTRKTRRRVRKRKKEIKRTSFLYNRNIWLTGDIFTDGLKGRLSDLGKDSIKPLKTYESPFLFVRILKVR